MSRAEDGAERALRDIARVAYWGAVTVLLGLASFLVFLGREVRLFRVAKTHNDSSVALDTRRLADSISGRERLDEEEMVRILASPVDGRRL